MDKALKQRLVGATVLIALAILILPMMFSGAGQPGSSESERIDLPQRPAELDFETRRFPLDGGTERTNADDAIDDALETGNTDEYPAPRLPAVEAGPAVTADPAETSAAAESADSPVPPPVVAQEPGTPVAEEPATNGAQSAPAASQEAPKSTDSPAEPQANAAAPGRYAVQVASLASRANSDRLEKDIRDLGYAVVRDTVESPSGTLNRVRAGPFGSESEAQDAIRRIREVVSGVNPRLVDLDPDGPDSVVAASDPLVRWVVQLGSFANEENASNLVSQVSQMNLSAYSEMVQTSGNQIHRVRVGPFLEREAALAARERLQQSLSINGVVMSDD